jgi:CHAT domain
LYEDSVPSPQARACLANGDWAKAIVLLQRELAEGQLHDPEATECRTIASLLAVALNQAGDYMPARRKWLASALQGILDHYAAGMLEDEKREDFILHSRLSSQANNIGWAAVTLSSFLAGDRIAMLETGVRLLEMAVRLSPPEKRPEAYSSCANNLAIGYQAQADVQAKDERPASLERAASLLQTVIEVDQRLSQSGDPRAQTIAESLYIDYLNLGLTYYRLAQHTYDATWISKKPLDSAHWYRKAIEALSRSCDLATAHERWEIAGTARNNLANIYISLCEHYTLEQYWSGKDLQRAFYDWLCALAGGHVKTTRLPDLYAQSALANATEAVVIGARLNPALMQESMTFLLRLWSLVNRKDAVPNYIACHTIVTLLESIDELEERGAFKYFAEELNGLAELRSILEALFRVDLYQMVTHDAGDLQAAHQTFTSLSREGNMITRALARPRADWLEVQLEPDGTLVNGLFLGKLEGGIELRVPSQRRRLHFYGMQVQQIGCEMRETSQIVTGSGGNLAHLEPLLNWDDLPPTIVTGKLLGTVNSGERITIEATRLPIASWDTWMLDLESEYPGKVVLTFSLPYVGKYNLIDGTLDSAFPAMLDNSAHVLIFGHQGITLEVALPISTADGQPTARSDAPQVDDEELKAGEESEETNADVTIHGTLETPEIQINARRLICLLKMAPRIASADVGYFVKDNDSSGATCCAASFSLIAPSYSFPATALHSFAPLFFFENTISPSALHFINQLNLHEIVMVGIPDNPIDADAALNVIFDPRRELFLLIEETELAIATSAVQRLRQRIATSIGGSYLVITAASSVGEYDPFENIQVVVVPRQWAATATQMLLDLAVLRHLNTEGIPFTFDGHIEFLNIKGNPLQAKRNRTLFYEVATWEDLQERYFTLLEHPLGVVMRSEHATDNIMSIVNPSLPKRPCLLLPSNKSASLAAIPYVRHLGAMPLPDTTETTVLLQRLRPTDVYVLEQSVEQIPTGEWLIHRIPDSSRDIASHFQQVVVQWYTNAIAQIGQTHPHLLSSLDLLKEMQPSEYVVLSLDDEENRSWAYVAANYAAALHAPLLLLDAQVIHSAEALEHNQSPFSSVDETVREGTDQERQAGPNEPVERLSMARELLGDTYQVLLAMKPTYVGFISPLSELSIELAGDRPLSIAFALGRLAGPDLTTTCILVAQAALNEDVGRPSTIQALLAEGFDALPAKPLPGAKSEVAAIYNMFASETDMDTKLVDTDTDVTTFLRHLETAHLVHFAGHGYYDEHQPTRSGLVFRKGILTPEDLKIPLRGAPIIFSNACETGRVGRNESPGGGRGRSGLAAGFITSGAVNYLGSLWPIFDDSSRRIAESFYQHLRTGYTVGEALRQARLEAYSENDSTWAAFVLFGCPRNRLRAEFIHDTVFRQNNGEENQPTPD